MSDFRILVVDASTANLDEITTILRGRGYKFTPVPSGELALLAVSRQRPDLILLNAYLPDMDGYQLCTQLKADDLLKDVPVIFLYHSMKPFDIKKAFKCGGSDHLTIPFQRDELQARVATHLELRQLRKELVESEHQLASAKDRASRDLTASVTFQRMFLPRQISQFAGHDLSWIYRPCEELGGDGLNLIPLTDDQIGLYILDVSGHGVAPALHALTLGQLLSPPSEQSSILVSHQEATGSQSIIPPSEVASLLDRLFPFDTATYQYVTMIYGILNTCSGEFKYVSAGHPNPIRVAADGSTEMLPSDGLPIGVCEQMREERSVFLTPKDRVYFYTDGIVEARNSEGRQFGLDQLVSVFKGLRHVPLQSAVLALNEQINQWIGSTKPDDDVSLLAFEFLKKP